MKDPKAFDIDIIGLKNKRYDFDFDGGNDFFALFEHSTVEKGKFRVHLQLDKSERMLQLDFSITGDIEVICDRSLDAFDYLLDIQQKHILKFGEQDQELTDEIEIISRDVTTINVAQYVYEFIILTIPMKKIHPRYESQTYEENEEGLLVYSSKTEPEETEGEETDVDPRWAALRKLGDN